MECIIEFIWSLWRDGTKHGVKKKLLLKNLSEVF